MRKMLLVFVLLATTFAGSSYALTIGFSENKNFTCFSIVDERCAAFFALGMAQQHNKPTVLVCSSGSALLNYYPAISEAFPQRIVASVAVACLAK